MSNFPAPPAPPAPAEAAVEAVPPPAPAPGPSGDNTEQESTPSKRKTKSQQDKDDHFEKILKMAQTEDHPVELALKAVAKQIIRTLDEEEQDELLEQLQSMSSIFFRERHRKQRASKRKTSGTASATVSVPPPPPLMAQPGNQNQNQVQQVEEGVGDILFKVTGALPPMEGYNVQYVREENGTTYMKM